jgi:hypothetical protein
MSRATTIRPSFALGLLVTWMVVSSAAPAIAQTSDTWTLTGSMTTKRPYDTATVLQNGQVLVAGGDVASAELYPPATGA